MQTDIYDGGTSSFFQTYRWHSNSNKIPFWLWSNTKHLYFRCFFGLRFWVGIYLWVTPQNSDSHSLLKIKSTSGTINLGAWKSADLRVPVTAPEGYTPIGLMSFDTAGAIPICINAMMISTVEVTVGLTNPSADTANNTGFTLSALYIKSTFVC